ncbi:MAG TPA: FadR family transcriptional regulator [Sediminispirochaeta sp.]|nr:FadR family transcriptional regulator [Sediminispirochaeta sp.]
MSDDTTFERIETKKIYRRVNDQIQQLILSGQLKIGDRLPAERQLSEQLGVSRNSIREALRSLEILGLIESKQGEGNFIVDRIAESFFEPLSILFKLHDGNFQDILEIRLILEVEAAALAAERIDEDAKRQLQLLLEKLTACTEERDCVEIDRMIHYRIAEATKNYLIIVFLEGISGILTRHIKNAREAILSAMHQRGILIDIHSRVIDAIIDNDPDAARTRMREHFQAVIESLSFVDNNEQL